MKEYQKTLKNMLFLTHYYEAIIDYFLVVSLLIILYLISFSYLKFYYFYFCLLYVESNRISLKSLWKFA